MPLPASITTNLFPDFKNSFIGPFARVSVLAQSTATTGQVAGLKCGQSIVATGGEIVRVEFMLNKTGSPTDDLSVQLCADSSGEPGTVLATSTSMSLATLTATASRYRFNFLQPYNAVAGTTYWLVLTRSSGTYDESNSFRPFGSGTNTYADGLFKIVNDFGTWVTSASVLDLGFTITTRESGRYQPCVDKTNHKARMFKSTDGGNTWSEQNSANAPTIISTANIRTISAAAQQDNFIAVMLPETTTFYKVFRFNTTTDTWETSFWAGSSSVVVNTNVSGAAPLPFAYRPFAATSTYAAAYNGAAETVMGNARRRVKVKRTGTAAPGYDLIGSPNTADLTTLPGTAVDHDLRAALHDGNGIWHCWWTQSDDSNLRHRSFDPDATTFTTINLMGSTPAVTSNSAAYPVGQPTNYYRGEWYIAIPYVDSGVLKVARCLASGAATASNWTITSVVTATIETTNSNPAVLVADNEQGGKLFLIYTKTDGKLYYTHDQANDVWVAEQELHPGTKTVGAISGGVMVDSIGLCYLDTAPATDDLKFDSL